MFAGPARAGAVSGRRNNRKGPAWVKSPASWLCDAQCFREFLPPETLIPDPARGRVGALLRRADRRTSCGRLRAGELEVDPPSREVRLRGDRVILSQKEFALLRTLVSDPTRVFTKEELLRGIWGYRSTGSTRTLDSHACRLRAKLGRHGDRYVINVWGVGYRLVDGIATQRADDRTRVAS